MCCRDIVTRCGVHPAMSPQVSCRSKGQHLFSLLSCAGCSSGSNSGLGWSSGLVWCFPDSFMDDVTYVGNFEVWVDCMICNIPGRICYGSENFGLSSLHDDCVGFAGGRNLVRTVWGWCGLQLSQWTIWNIRLVHCVRKVAVHLQNVLEVVSTSVYTGLNPFNFVHKHFLQICVRKVAVRL
jgi:hypothetical protein